MVECFEETPNGELFEKKKNKITLNYMGKKIAKDSQSKKVYYSI